MTSLAIEIHNLEKRYPSPEGGSLQVLDIPHLCLERGAELALAGPSGAGKSTLLQIISGITLASSGEIRVLGETLHLRTESERDRFRAQQIGYIFQRANLLDGFSALENVLLAMGFATIVPRTKRRERATALLEQVGLTQRMNHRPGQLSSGQQQRVALARALANEPALLLADEPTASVDAPTGQQLLKLLRQFCQERGAALVFVSHDQAMLEQFANRAEMREGRIVKPAKQPLDSLVEFR